MADSASENNSQKQNSKRVRVTYSRAKSSEEKSKQLKEWKKRKREQRRAAKLIVTRREGNEKANTPTCDTRTRTDQKKRSSPLPETTDFPSNARQPRESYSRGALMLQAARSRKVGFIEPVNTSKPRHSKFHRDPRPVRKGCVTSKDAKADLKELNPDHIEYLSERVVGRGSYGECYRGRYRGIDVISTGKENKQRLQTFSFYT